MKLATRDNGERDGCLVVVSRDLTLMADAADIAPTLQQALEQDACFTLRQLAVNGRDLLEQGYRGREVGAALQFMLDAVIDGTLPNEKQTLLKVLSTEFASNATE